MDQFQILSENYIDANIKGIYMSIEDEMNFVIKKIRDIRVEKKISQMELANIANC